MGERIVDIGGVGLCVETFGDPAHPAILLVSGMSASMDWWPEELCARLAAGLRYVIRYDFRDTGRSVHYPPGKPGYAFRDLVDDAVGILDALGVARAHLVGISMGGALAQVFALDHADRVASLTLVATSAVTPGRADLPSMDDGLRAYFENTPEPDWSDRPAVVEYLVDFERHLSGPGLDEPALRAAVTRAVERTADPAAAGNHRLIDGVDVPAGRLRAIAAPTLVIHGTDDRLFPLPHGRALADEIPDARLLALPGMGHQVPPPSTWDTVVPALLHHTSGGWEDQAGRLATVALAGGEPAGWFERLYAAAEAGEVAMPWDRTVPHPLLVEWVGAGRPGAEPAAGRRALVVGCGPGGDAEHVASLGWRTVAFDVSPTAVAIARRRFPESGVDYRVADLLDPPAEWADAFDLVVEIHTVQALPPSARGPAIANVARTVAPGGTLLVVAFAADEPVGDGPPWPLTRSDVDGFAAGGLVAVRVEDVPGTTRRWRAEFHRPAPA